MNARDKREHSQFVQWRGAKGRARVAITRTPGRIVTTESGATVRVRGAGIVILPVPLNKAMRKALLHFCEKRGVVLVPCEANRELPLGIRPEQLGQLALVTAFQAFGAPAALKQLTEHGYVGHERWYFVTTARGTHDATTLARKVVKGQNDKVGCKWTTAHNAFLRGMREGDATKIHANLPKISTGKGRTE